MPMLFTCVGTAIELALKYAITIRLNWPKYRTDSKLKFLKTHDLDMLAALTGQEVAIKQMPGWSAAIKWDETRRYEDPNLAQENDALAMLQAAKEFAEFLCGISL